MPLVPEEIERALAASWPALETVRDGNWQARFAKGYSGRSNSIQSFDPADTDDAEARIVRLSAHYRDRAIVPAFKVTPLTGGSIPPALDALGWTLYHDSLVLAADAAAMTPRSGGEGVAVLMPTALAWRDAQVHLQGYSQTTRAILAEMAALLPAPSAGFLLADAEGQPLASALCAVAQGIAVPLNVVTASNARGRGYGRRVMDGLVSWSRAQGAHALAIQVQRDNAPALALYRSLGFADLYAYHYRRGSLAP